MADPVATQIVSAVLARVASLALAEGGYVKAIKRAAARLDGRMTEAVWQAALVEMSGNAPAIFVGVDAYRNFTGNTGGRAQSWQGDADLYVYCATDYRGSLTEGRLDPDDSADLDPTADQGMWRLVEDVFVRLAGWSPQSNVYRLNPAAGKFVVVDEAVTVWEWQFSVSVVLASNPLPSAPVVTSVRVDNHVPNDPAVIITTEDLP
jgi:hypothetical protein